MPPVPISALIVDDERLARQRLRSLLNLEDDIDVVGEAENGLQALAAITTLAPDLVFLDIQMPDLDGLGVIAALGGDDVPEIIFVTAHSAYMERAFEVHAVDYLRKPYPDARFSSALDHARRRIHARRAETAASSQAAMSSASTISRYGSVLADLRDVNEDPRVALQDGNTGTWHIVNRDEIDWISADGSSRARVHVGKESYLWRKTLAEVERALDPRVFMRVHRSYIVNTARIRQIKPLLKGEFTIFLAEGKILDTGRTYRGAVEAFLRARAQPFSAVDARA